MHPHARVMLALLGLWLAVAPAARAATLSCADFAAQYCADQPLLTDTLVVGGSAALPECFVQLAAGVTLRFKNAENPEACLTTTHLQVTGLHGSRLRIEHTLLEATTLVLTGGIASLVHLEDAQLLVQGSATIGGRGQVLLEDTRVEAGSLGLSAQGAGSELTLKGAQLQATDALTLFAAGEAAKIKAGSSLHATSIDLSTAPGTLLAVTGAVLTAPSMSVGVNGGPGDVVDLLKGNTWQGGNVTVQCPARITGNVFQLTGTLLIAGSAPCLCSKNTPEVVCPQP